MTIWQSISKDRVTPDDFIVCIEISKGMKSKYEVDKETGLLMLDRILYTATHYPANYGFIPRTYSNDGDPLDVLVICSEPIYPMTLVRCYPIGQVSMVDEGKEDIKILAIPFRDPNWNCFRDVSGLPLHIIDEIKHFFSVYKHLEGKKMEVLEMGNVDIDKKTIKESIRMYDSIFPDM